MKTYMAKPQDVERKWYVVDATDMVLGRLASNVASVLRGKNKPTFTPNVDTGDHVIVVNCSKVVLTGKKLEKKYHTYHTGYVGGLKQIQYKKLEKKYHTYHTGYVGGLKQIQYKKLMESSPEKAVMLAVKGMLPKNSLGRQMLKKLRVYAGPEHNHEAQKPVELKF